MVFCEEELLLLLLLMVPRARVLSSRGLHGNEDHALCEMGLYTARALCCVTAGYGGKRRLRFLPFFDFSPLRVLLQGVESASNVEPVIIRTRDEGSAY